MFMTNLAFKIRTGWLSSDWDTSRMIFGEK